MLSILIPVYDYDVTSLVQEVRAQAEKAQILFEIICLNDASSSLKPEISSDNFRWIENEVNLGRAKSRNKLVNEACFEALLFLDADMQLVHPSFIQNYISALEKAPVLCGGICYQKKSPKDSLKLRWNYGKKYEARPAMEREDEPYTSFMTGNFLATKEVLQKHSFDESLTSYGHEDTLLGKNLLEDGISIYHFDNVSLHAGLEDNDEFIRKTKEGLRSLLQLYKEKKITRHYSGVVRTFENLTTSGTLYFMIPFISLAERLFYTKLVAKGKYLWLFQLLKLKWFVEMLRKS